MQFRAYFIDENEHVRSAIDVAAPDAPAAVERAQRLQGSFTVELWEIGDFDRLLQRFEALRASRRASLGERRVG